MKNDSGVVAAVKARANIVEIVGRYVNLRPVGSRLVGPCPFHQETKGSFNVHPDKGFFHCFGCQASGDVIDFYCRINGLEFREGLERLASELGVDLGRVRSDPRAAAKKQARDACLAMHELADRYFRHLLGQGEGRVAREYLEKRGVSPEMIERFALGVSPEGWQGLQSVLRSRGFDDDGAVTAGLLTLGKNGRTWDRFRGRLMFPIRDGGGRVIAFGGRTMGDGDPKYLNSAETPIYTKGQNLYGLFEARPVMAKTRRALLTEGYLDVITLHQYGYGEACGVLGTAMTHEQARRLSGFAPRVDLVFDGDPPGRKAALRAAQMLLTLGGACRVVPLPDGEDVDSLLHAAGREGFEACLARAEDGLGFCLRMVRDAFSPKEIITWAMEFLGGLADDGLRAVFVPRVASGLGLAEVELRRMLSAPGKRPPSGNVAAGSAPHRPQTLELSSRDAQMLSFAVRRPDYAPSLVEQGLAGMLDSAAARDFFAKLAGGTPDEPAPRLSEAETAFWTKAQLEPALADEEAAAFFEEICIFLHEARENDRRRAIMEAIRRAQQQGASDEALRLLGELQALSGRGDE
ncbi:DNA primase [Desulfovibrio sp. TomC]|uniref:DNA primase n=1 Tax=Desulfovibrio sp. TomC TaxID=1562888 RepID=UPI000575BC94|nr:DNA primase [Desulfovibrio sp. TomC]KHK04051.1 DNA primase [Desulfovibrio sp. TomC]